MQTGTIARFGGRGFGFIRPSDEGNDIFFHANDCRFRKELLRVGEKVAFELNQPALRRGQRQACEVRIIRK